MFLYTSSRQVGEALTHHGYVLTQAQIGDAEDEVSRRTARRAARQNELRLRERGQGRAKRQRALVLFQASLHRGEH